MRKKARKIKILFIITKSNWGGAQRYVYDLATNIAKNGYDLAVALGGNGAFKNKLENSYIKTISIPNLNRDINIFSELKVFFSLLRILKNERPDVVHLNSSKIGGIGALATRVYNLLPKGNSLKTKSYKLTAKIIFTAHGWAYKENRNIISKKIIFFLSWFTVIFSDKTITVSADDFNDAPKLFVRKKIIMIHNGISKIDFRDKILSRKILISKLNISIKNSLWIGTISELHKNKGIPFAIYAIKNLIKKNYNISFFIIGEGEEKFKLKQLIKKLELENNVFLLGHIDNASELLYAFDIFALTSTKEGLPYVLLEAGLAGLPVVATKIGGIPDIIENKKLGRLARVKNIYDIENAISDLVDFKKDAIKYGENLKEKVEKDFTIEQMIAETIKTYE